MIYRSSALLLGMTLFAACEQDGTGQPQTTPIGNRYQIIESNADGRLAEPGDYIYFNARLLTEGDSLVIDTETSGDEQPVVQALNDTIVNEQTGPVEDVLRFVRSGERVRIRQDISDYPANFRPPGMENDSVMIYEVTVTDIIDQEEFTRRQDSVNAVQQEAMQAVRSREPEVVDFSQQLYDQYTEGELENQLQTTASGLKYIIHEEGTGEEADPGKTVVVQYIGRLVSNGEIFDQSFERGMGIPFPLGQGRVIPGWDEGIDLLKEGARASFFIPSELAYGDRDMGNGAIPANSELMFYVELEEVR